VVGILLSIIFSLPSSHLRSSDSPEIGPGELIGASNSSSTRAGSTTQTAPATGLPASTTSPPSSPTSSSSRSSSSNTGPIVGGVVAAVAIIAIVILGIIYLRRRRHRNSPYAASSVTAPPSAPLVLDGGLPTHIGGRKAMSEDGTIASSSMPPDSPVTATSMRIYVRTSCLYVAFVLVHLFFFLYYAESE